MSSEIPEKVLKDILESIPKREILGYENWELGIVLECSPRRGIHPVCEMEVFVEFKFVVQKLTLCGLGLCDLYHLEAAIKNPFCRDEALRVVAFKRHKSDSNFVDYDLANFIILGKVWIKGLNYTPEWYR